ncbi:MAG: branched-chain amino acid transporter permease [Syntrophomonadaceae bacterium]|jgi:branched-subunit amino acid transport protein AzlD
MILTPTQVLVIVGMVTIGTMITRFLPFILFKGTNSNNSYIGYLGQVLPYAAIGLLIVYCLKNVSFRNPAYWVPEAIAIICIIVLHNWRGNALLSIGAGTAIYMVLVQAVFV